VDLKLNCTHQLLVYADDINIVCASVHAVKKNTGYLVVVSKETGLEEYSDKSKYMVVTRDQNAGRSHSMKIDNNSCKSVLHFEYLGTTATNQNSIQEEIKSRIMSECLISFGAESFVFHFATQKYAD
jgi:hypothetical protein